MWHLLKLKPNKFLLHLFIYFLTYFVKLVFWHFNNVQKSLHFLRFVPSDIHTGCISDFMQRCVSVHEEKDESRNESLLPDNSSLGSLSCCQPGEQQGWKSLQCTADVLYVSLTYQSAGQWAVASAPLRHTLALDFVDVFGVCVSTQIGKRSSYKAKIRSVKISFKWTKIREIFISAYLSVFMLFPIIYFYRYIHIDSD